MVNFGRIVLTEKCSGVTFLLIWDFPTLVSRDTSFSVSSKASIALFKASATAEACLKNSFLLLNSLSGVSLNA